MSEWWSSIPAFEKIFWYFAIPFSAVFLIQLIMTVIGADGHHDDADVSSHDHDFGHHDGMLEGAFKLFTVRNFITFFTVFGWAGITMTNTGAGKILTVVIALVLALVVMILVAGLFYLAMRMTESGNVDIQRAVGHTGKVYIPIPAKEAGIGKVHITFHGSFREVEAMTTGEEIETGALVEVLDVLNHEVLLVEKIEKRGWE